MTSLCFKLCFLYFVTGFVTKNYAFMTCFAETIKAEPFKNMVDDIDILKSIEKKNKTYLDNYEGDYFPRKYLFAANVISKSSFIDLYTERLERMVGYCANTPNLTDINHGLAFYFTKAILKRTLQDYSYKIDDALETRIKTIIKVSDNLLTHYIYKNRRYGWDDPEFRASLIFRDDETQVFSIQKFKRYRLFKWLVDKTDMHTFSRDMDTLVLPREKYVELVRIRDGYHIDIKYSDICVSNIIYNPTPININQMHQCNISKTCDRLIHSTPSVAYGLSHRLLNMLLHHGVSRCYLRSERGDMREMEKMCAFMYREAVYLARRGFFARDLFLEHVALCGMLGYEEFHRHHWFHKAASWIDEEGCIAESHNFVVNATAIFLKKTTDGLERRRLKKIQKLTLAEYCHKHPMSLLKIVLAHGIRHALHHLPNNKIHTQRHNISIPLSTMVYKKVRSQIGIT